MSKAPRRQPLPCEQPNPAVRAVALVRHTA